MPRQQIQPVNRGASAPNRLRRTTEWMPSAPTTMSASISLPSAKRATALRAFALRRDAPRAEPDVGGLERLGEDANQIGAVRGEIRRAEIPPVIAAALARGETAAFPVADVEKVGLEADCLDGVVQSERTQRLDGIGREIEAGADLAQRAGLFADDGFGAALLQRQRSGKAADAAADNGDARFAWHGRCPPARLVVTLTHSMRTDAPRECNQILLRGALHGGGF